MGLLVVCDLNGVLCNQYGRPNAGARAFFDWLCGPLSGCELAVWTSKSEKNGRTIIRKIEKAVERELPLKFAWFRPQCTLSPTIDEPYGTVKDLRKVWAAYPEYSPENTILVDDSEVKAGDLRSCLILCNNSCLDTVREEISARLGALEGLQGRAPIG